MIESWNITIPELTGEKKRRAYVYLPDSLERDPGQRFPVLYMFDGHNLFYDEEATYGKSWGLGDYLSEHDVPLMVAAVECNHDPNNGRLSEYAPWSFRAKEFGPVRGRGQETMEWWVNQFKPFVDGHFPTLPARETTFIGGSSMGGLMSLYALLEYPGVFSRAAALSPSLWCAPGEVARLIREAKLWPETVLYMDYGDLELENHPQMLRRFSRTAAALMEQGVRLTCRVVPGGSHNESSWQRQIPFFLQTLLYEE
jgi:predicted alpha/beta superfamily hydrolase